MKIASHQPNYLPNLGYFYKMAHVDKFVIVTNVQFSKGDGWVRRHMIKGSNQDQWLTVPVTGSSSGQLIKEVMIDNSHKWRMNHKLNIKQAYRRTADQDALEKVLKIYDKKWDRLADLNIALIHCIKEILQIDTEIVLDEEVDGMKWDLLINVCKEHQGDVYLSGMGGKEYFTDEHYQQLKENNITLEFVQHDVTSMYPYTALHYMFTHGVDTVRALLHDPDSVHIEEPALVVA